MKGPGEDLAPETKNAVTIEAAPQGAVRAGGNEYLYGSELAKLSPGAI